MPKKIEVHDIINFKPISLVGGLYKFRLKKFIKQVISNTQKSFVEDRHIPNTYTYTCNKAKDFTKMSFKMQKFLYQCNTEISINPTNKNV